MIFKLAFAACLLALSQDERAKLEEQKKAVQEILEQFRAANGMTADVIARYEEKERLWKKAAPAREARYARAKAVLQKFVDRQTGAADEAKKLAEDSDRAAHEAYQAACELGLQAAETWAGGKLAEQLKDRARIRDRMSKMAETTLRTHPDAATQAKYAKILKAHNDVLEKLETALLGLHAAQASHHQMEYKEALEKHDGPALHRLSKIAKDRLASIHYGIEAVEDYLKLVAPYAADQVVSVYVKEMNHVLKNYGAFALIPFGDRYISAMVDYADDWMEVVRLVDEIGSGSADPKQPRPDRNKADQALDSLRKLVMKHGDQEKAHAEMQGKLETLKKKYAANLEKIARNEQRIREIERILATLKD